MVWVGVVTDESIIIKFGLDIMIMLLLWCGVGVAVMKFILSHISPEKMGSCRFLKFV